MALDSIFGNQGFGYVVAVEGLSGLETDFDEVTDKIAKRASMAINATAKKFRTRSSKLMRDNIAFPASYLTGPTGKLRVRQMASPTRLEAAISGRFDPTSLTRFIPEGRRTAGRKNPTLHVSQGERSKVSGSFILKLKNDNVGLAIRLKPGETVRNRRKQVSYSKKDRGLILLYGPSVDQVFRGVADDVAPEAAIFLEAEFTRLTENLI